MPPHHRLSRLEVIAASKLLESVIVVNSDGTAQYREDQDDASIATTLGPRYTPVMIGTLRREMFGNFKPKREKKDSLLARIEALEQWAAARTKAPFGAKKKLELL